VGSPGPLAPLCFSGWVPWTLGWVVWTPGWLLTSLGSPPCVPLEPWARLAPLGGSPGPLGGSSGSWVVTQFPGLPPSGFPWTLAPPWASLGGSAGSLGGSSGPLGGYSVPWAPPPGLHLLDTEWIFHSENHYISFACLRICHSTGS
jgi:hypothetical protein